MFRSFVQRGIADSVMQNVHAYKFIILHFISLLLATEVMKKLLNTWKLILRSNFDLMMPVNFGYLFEDIYMPFVAAKTAYIFSQRGNVNQRIMIKKEFVLFQENFLFTPPDKTKQDKLSFELVSCVK